MAPVSLARREGSSAAQEDPRFDLCIAPGDSITAGFESAGINDSTQPNSYTG
jgi:hypothetical protein